MADAQNVFSRNRPLLPKTEHNGPVWLMQAHYGCEEWPKGWFGLVFCNDPFVVWEWAPTSEPHVSLSKGKSRKAAIKRWENWFKDSGKAAEAFNGLDITTAFDLVTACTKAGYDRSKDGDVALWLMGFIGKALKNRVRSTEKDWGKPAFEYQRPRGRPKKPGYKSSK